MGVGAGLGVRGPDPDAREELMWTAGGAGADRSRLEVTTIQTGLSPPTDPGLPRDVHIM